MPRNEIALRPRESRKAFSLDRLPHRGNTSERKEMRRMESRLRLLLTSVVQIKKRSLLGPALVAVAMTALLNSGATPGLSAPPAADAAAPASAGSEQAALDAYGKLPLAFVPNRGQADARVRFSAQAGGASFSFTQKAAVLTLAKGKKAVALQLAFLGANPKPLIEGRRAGPGRVNYLLGNDPAKWQTNLPTYGEVVYRELWPGIDMVFRGARGAAQVRVPTSGRARRRPTSGSPTAARTASRWRGAGRCGSQTPLGRSHATSARAATSSSDGERVAGREPLRAPGRAEAYGFALGELRPAPAAGDRPRPALLDLPGRKQFRPGRRRSRSTARATPTSPVTQVSGDFPTHAGAVRHQRSTAAATRS